MDELKARSYAIQTPLQPASIDVKVVIIICRLLQNSYRNCAAELKEGVIFYTQNGKRYVNIKLSHVLILRKTKNVTFQSRGETLPLDERQWVRNRPSR